MTANFRGKKELEHIRLANRLMFQHYCVFIRVNNKTEDNNTYSQPRIGVQLLLDSWLNSISIYWIMDQRTGVDIVNVQAPHTL